jgi:hypothetical protein
MVVNVVGLVFAALGLVSLAPALDTPQLERMGLYISMLVIGFICNLVGIWGSLNFNKHGIMIAGVWFALEAILGLALFTDFVGAAIAISFLYPHVVFYRELQKGIMSRETYANEKECCGCV